MRERRLSQHDPFDMVDDGDDRGAVGRNHIETLSLSIAQISADHEQEDGRGPEAHSENEAGIVQPQSEIGGKHQSISRGHRREDVARRTHAREGDDPAEQVDRDHERHDRAGRGAHALGHCPSRGEVGSRSAAAGPRSAAGRRGSDSEAGRENWPATPSEGRDARFDSVGRANSRLGVLARRLRHCALTFILLARSRNRRLTSLRVIRHQPFDISRHFPP